MNSPIIKHKQVLQLTSLATDRQCYLIRIGRRANSRSADFETRKFEANNWLHRACRCEPNFVPFAAQVLAERMIFGLILSLLIVHRIRGSVFSAAATHILNDSSQRREPGRKPEVLQDSLSNLDKTRISRAIILHTSKNVKHSSIGKLNPIKDALEFRHRIRSSERLIRTLLVCVPQTPQRTRAVNWPARMSLIASTSGNPPLSARRRA